MAELSIALLGGFTVTLGGEAVRGFTSNKERALLAYLAVEMRHIHQRDSLATLLWPGYPGRSARANLRGALAGLRTAISDRDAVPPFLNITRDTIQFNTSSDHSLDVAKLEGALASVRHLSTDELMAAADLSGASSWQASRSQTRWPLTTGSQQLGNAYGGRRWT